MLAIVVTFEVSHFPMSMLNGLFKKRSTMLVNRVVQTQLKSAGVNIVLNAVKLPPLITSSNSASPTT